MLIVPLAKLIIHELHMLILTRNMTKLKRTVTWQTFALYGLGNILGAGIYVLVGEVAAEARAGLIWSFAIAGVIATFTALTYSALAAKYPVSAGAAVYTDRAFNSPRLSTGIGLALAFTGVVSASALLRGFNRYFQELLNTVRIPTPPSWLVIFGALAVLGLIAYRGITESTRLAVVLTILEAGGLLLIIAVAFLFGSPAQAISQSTASLGGIEPLGIILGAFLAFYAFIGFEDMVNIAEEVKQPKTSLRRGMLAALISATVLYLTVALAALAVLPGEQLAGSNAPLADVFQAATGSSLPIITVIGLFAVTNGVLAQIIMSSRVLYGLAREGWLPKQLAKVSSTTHTPSIATLLSLGGILLGALLLPLGTLAQITSFGLLIIFSIVQLAAIRLRTKDNLRLTAWIPIIGLLTNVGILGIQASAWLGVV